MRLSNRKVRWIAASFVFAAVLSIVSAAASFYGMFHDVPLQKDSSAWSNFGSYFGGVLTPALGLLNLAAVLVIALQFTEHQQHSLSAKRLAVDLMTEWNGHDLHESRRAVSGLVASVARGESLLPSLSEFEENGSDVSVHAFRLYHFFEKWAVLSDVNEVDQRITLAALGSRASWYQQNFFNPIRRKERNLDIQKTLNYINKHVFEQLP